VSKGIEGTVEATIDAVRMGRNPEGAKTMAPALDVVLADRLPAGVGQDLEVLLGHLGERYRQDIELLALD